MKIILLIALLAIGAGIVETKASLLARFRLAKGPRKIEKSTFFVLVLRNFEYKCSGSLISWSHVLTVAHCVVDKSYERYPNLMVVSGRVKKYSGGTFHKVKNVIYPRGFKRSPKMKMEKDIAVLTLDESIRPGGEEKPIPLASAKPMDNVRSQNSLSLKAQLITFIDRSQPEDESLHELPTTVYPHKKCITGETKIGFDETRDVFCGVNNMKKLSRHITRIEGGSPLIQKDGLIGIATYTPPTEDTRSNYVNVEKYTPFIYKAMYSPDDAGVVL